MIGINTKARLVCIAVAFVASASAQTGAWAPPVVLSTGGQGWEAAAAIDGSGNSVALWDERTTLDQLWSRSKPSGGSWGSVTEVSPALQTVSVLPAVRIAATGFATAVWSDDNGVWTADRPTASKWNTAQLLIPGASNPIFVMNSQGAAAIVWTVGGPRGPGSSVMAVVRPAGGVWTSQQTVASGVFVAADHAGIDRQLCGGSFNSSWQRPRLSHQDAGGRCRRVSGARGTPQPSSVPAGISYDRQPAGRGGCGAGQLPAGVQTTRPLRRARQFRHLALSHRRQLLARPGALPQAA